MVCIYSESRGIPPHKILHIGKFIETDYTAEPYVEDLERRGLQSDTILLSGKTLFHTNYISIDAFNFLHNIGKHCLQLLKYLLNFRSDLCRFGSFKFLWVVCD